MYNGTTDPEDHLHSFRTGMEDMTIQRDIWYRIFRRTLLGEAIGWYRGLPPHSIHAFEDLERLFRIAFSFHTRRKKGKQPY